jgi:hypothetical protein
VSDSGFDTTRAYRFASLAFTSIDIKFIAFTSIAFAFFKHHPSARQPVCPHMNSEQQ